jgi:2-haloalkanoic acid dehalogenase type II
VTAVLLDLLSAVMNSLAAWSEAARDPRVGLAWRDAVTRRIAASPTYVPYEAEVVGATADVGLPPAAASELFERWREMEPWPDSAVLSRLVLPYAFVTNCSKELAQVAAERSQLAPRFVLSAEEAGWYKPDARIYREGCMRLASPPESTLFVAGSAYDADGARAAGLRSVLVARRPDERTNASAASLDDIVIEIATSGSSRC